MGEVALSVMLLVSAALLIQSLYRLNQERLGFSPQGLLTFSMPPPQGGYRTGPDHHVSGSRSRAARRFPGVRAVGGDQRFAAHRQSNFPAQQEGNPSTASAGWKFAT